MVITRMTGNGAPKYLGWSCLSIEASKSLFDMIIFHEDNNIIESLNCASNVKKINVHKGGLARLIAKAIAKPFLPLDKDIATKEVQLASVLTTVLEHIPFFLAQFKIGVSQNHVMTYILHVCTYSSIVPETCPPILI